MPKKQLQGIVFSDKMNKTVVVRVERIKQHPKYRKRFRAYKKYKAHYEGDELQKGDKVTIQECRPISKDKTWRVIGETKGKKEE